MKEIDILYYGKEFVYFVFYGNIFFRKSKYNVVVYSKFVSIFFFYLGFKYFVLLLVLFRIGFLLRNCVCLYRNVLYIEDDLEEIYCSGCYLIFREYKFCVFDVYVWLIVE